MGRFIMTSENFYRADEEVRAEPYPYRACGLDNIFLLNGYDVHEHDGESAVSVKQEDELLQAIGRHVVFTRKALSGKEIRFLRNVLDMTQNELANKLGTTAQTLARWEKGEFEITGPAEKLLRIVFIIHAGTDEEREVLLKAIEDALDQLDEIDQTRPPKVQFELKEHWIEKHLLACA